jgi:hypothetical protein
MHCDCTSTTRPHCKRSRVGALCRCRCHGASTATVVLALAALAVLLLAGVG